MRAVDIIRKKRDGAALTNEEIAAFVHAATHEDWPDYQLSALLMAIWLRGMSPEETAALTHAMTHSGEVLPLDDIPGPKCDKHSTGGVGDSTSLVMVPLAAACGVLVPMMSGRGLGHTGGTLDKLEAIPGFRVNLSIAETKAALRATGAAMIGQTAAIAPADRKLYALRDVTATVESIPLIASSILSKKLAEGISSLVLDVKFGNGAFMKNLDDARTLARTLVDIATSQGVRTEALLTSMDDPLGHAIGNTLEVIECVEILKGRGPRDLAELSLELGARMVFLSGVASSLEDGRTRVRAALTSGQAVEKFRQIITQQGGDPHCLDDYRRLPLATRVEKVIASRSGYVAMLEAEPIGRAAMRLGAGRDRAEDVVDPGVGILLRVKPGEHVKAGQTLAELYGTDSLRLAEAAALVAGACRFVDEPPPRRPLIRETIQAAP